MKLVFRCGICAKNDTLELMDKNKTYLIGRDFETLDIKLCTDEKNILSRIQAHIKWDRNAWRIFDGMPADTLGAGSAGMQKPDSFGGTFLKRNKNIRHIEYGTGEELRVGDTVFFVITEKADREAKNSWLKNAGRGPQAAFYKYDGFRFRGDKEYYEGFKYRFDVISDEHIVKSKTSASNLYLPDGFSKDLAPGKLHHNSCVGLDIRSSTEADLETQRDYWIPQFNAILNKLLAGQKDYLLILLGDGAYVN
ncbi:MAG TPA: FHA domain-containing protein, partial [Spirochaetota bacterium]|nr:FHA domain-containing protein [Spirochaetota bacterium]